MKRKREEKWRGRKKRGMDEKFVIRKRKKRKLEDKWRG
jgi:hypothetical protein